MTAGFEGDVEGPASRPCAGLAEGDDFGMWAARLAVGPLTDDPAAGYHHGADHRIRAGGTPALRREAKRQGHIVTIAGRRPHRFVRLGRRTTRLATSRFFAGAGVAAFLAGLDFTACLMLD